MRRFLTAVLLASAAQTLPAAGQSTNAPPVIETFDALDPATLPWITPEQRANVAALLEDYKAGRIAYFVVASSPRGTYVTRTWFALSTGLEEVARQALESCEYVDETPCRLVAVSDRATKRPGGGWAGQPVLLSGEGGLFDHRRVPFVVDADRANLRAYTRAARPKVMMLNNGGYWAYRSGATIAEALAEATKGCEGEPKTTTCFVYAVDDHVVFTPVN